MRIGKIKIADKSCVDFGLLLLQ